MSFTLLQKQVALNVKLLNTNFSFSVSPVLKLNELHLVKRSSSFCGSYLQSDMVEAREREIEFLSRILI